MSTGISSGTKSIQSETSYTLYSAPCSICYHPLVKNTGGITVDKQLLFPKINLYISFRQTFAAKILNMGSVEEPKTYDVVVIGGGM
jgi:hypothetical protein